MPDPIDCSSMSHRACLPELESGSESTEEQQDRYDCVNECLSGLGLPTAVAGTAVAVGCVIVSAGACGVLAGGMLGAFVGACDANCDKVPGS